jgi:hypothetical protein
MHAIAAQKWLAGDPVFIDSDVIIKTNTLTKIAESFETHPEISALFGSLR